MHPQNVIENSLGIKMYLIVCLIAVRKSQVIIEALNIKIWEDELILDHLPDDAGHLVTIHLDNRLVKLDTLASGVYIENLDIYLNLQVV